MTVAYKCWKSVSDEFIIAEQVYSHVPRVLILDSLSRRVYETLHLDDFRHQLDDGIWIEQTPESSTSAGLEVSENSKEADSDAAHVAQLIMLIDQFTDHLHPLRHSNSYKFLKKKFQI